MKLGFIVSILFWIGIAVVTQGCSGVEVGLKTGIYRVDEREQTERMATSYRNTKPLKCLFVNCSQEAENGNDK